jgi:poly(3-hydroxybutyrate) depolymerase
MKLPNLRNVFHENAFAFFQTGIKTQLCKLINGIWIVLLTVACAHAEPHVHAKPRATEVGNYDGDPTRTWDGVVKAGVQVRTFTQPDLMNPGQTVLRRYLQYVPKHLPRHGNYPLVIMLPGASLSAEVGREWDWGDRAERLADKEKFLLVYANGHAPSDLTDANPGNPFFANGGYWRACFEKPGTGPEFFSVDDVDYLKRIIQNVQKEGLPLDKKRIYLMGMSNGAEMVQRAAREMPELLAGVGAVMPVYSLPANVEWFNCGQRPQLPVDMMFIYSPGDTLLDRIFADAGFNYAELMQDSLAAWREALKIPAHREKARLLPNRHMEGKGYCPSESNSAPWAQASVNSRIIRYDYPQGESGARFAVLEIVSAAGHAWPNNTSTSFDVAEQPYNGFRNQDIDAEKVLWEFFKKGRK